MMYDKDRTQPAICPNCKEAFSAKWNRKLNQFQIFCSQSCAWTRRKITYYNNAMKEKERRTHG